MVLKTIVCHKKRTEEILQSRPTPGTRQVWIIFINYVKSTAKPRIINNSFDFKFWIFVIKYWNKLEDKNSESYRTVKNKWSICKWLMERSQNLNKNIDSILLECNFWFYDRKLGFQQLADWENKNVTVALNFPVRSGKVLQSALLY